ncbi:MAG: hypothetical protein ACR2MN_17005 [Acidimicrobiales bacterium]
MASIENTVAVTSARQLTEDIRSAITMAWDLIQEAYTSRAWASLGYASWESYCSAEFNPGRLRLPKGERTEVVLSLRSVGMSTRGIVATTGLSKGTVGRELSGAPFGAPGVVTGADGKTYKAAQARAEAIRAGINQGAKNLDGARACLDAAMSAADQIPERDEQVVAYSLIANVAEDLEALAADHVVHMDHLIEEAQRG